jgi:hypothetical protein
MTEEEPRHYLLTAGIEVTMRQHLDLLASPKKCNILGIDNTYERTVYGHQHEWYNWPPLPEIDPKEEEWNGYYSSPE